MNTYNPDQNCLTWAMTYASEQFYDGYIYGQTDALGPLNSLSEELDAKLAIAQDILNKMRCLAVAITPNAPASWCASPALPPKRVSPGPGGKP
jgi:hypothetical protein